jgi:putative pyruvate formate lyase activating enzyme
LFQPSYLDSSCRTNISDLADKLALKLFNCNICPNNCNIDRKYMFGKCRSRIFPIVSSYCIHEGEEPFLVKKDKTSGNYGVGNIFLGNCNLRCVYCQNYQISQNPDENIFETTSENLANIILELQNKKVNSIGFVSPTHFVPQVLSAINIGIHKGLKLPLIFNSNGYDSLEILKLIDGIFDIYLPDLKYYINNSAVQYSNANNYFHFASGNIIEMYRQIGSKLIIENGILKRGLIIRHLVIPGLLEDTYKILKFISELDREITISIMSQYYPTYLSHKYETLNRKITLQEYNKVLDWLNYFELEHGYVQDLDSNENYKPNFINRNNPFI